ncbi:hypothetical protein Tsubulata_015693 [Turnera subulata]|uniref:VHS domain-containing protein n=1 Tax=Turnera subulata TaxID=218843 RepID=A0A9Q0JHP7_9ROSI|nr:hypothetical protein Tsubulata_015693 [Turnera subulata]
MALAMAMSTFPPSSATVAVEKATSDLLIGPDWTMNIDICDSINSNRWQAKDVVKAVKKRIQHRNPRVQLLALTLLETMVKNCGEFVHSQIAEKNILGDMVKIVRKKSDMHVRDKILVLLDSWQEAFGGSGGRYPQYYWAYDELRRSGVTFPQRSLDASPIFTPPVTHPAMRHPQAAYGMPGNSSRRLDETMATEIEGLSTSSLEAMRNVMELLSDMLQAVNPGDREAVKDEIIVDLVNRCRSNQKLLMQMLTTTGDEELLGQGLELNDSLQILLAKYDAILSGSPMPNQDASLSAKPTEGGNDTKPAELKEASPRASTSPSVVSGLTRSLIDEEDEEEDDFAQLARRHSKTQSSPPQSTSGTSSALVLVDTTSMTSASTPVECNALALPDPPAPVRTSKEQDIIDLLSITLSTISTSPHPQSPPTAATTNQNMHQIPVSSSMQGYPHVSQTYSDTQGQLPYSSYVVPWAQAHPQQQLYPPSQHQFQPRPQQHLQPPSQPQLQPQSSFHLQTQAQPHQPQPQMQPQYQPHPQTQTRPQLQSQFPQYASAYPPPPWAATPGYANGQNPMSTSNNVFSGTGGNASASFPALQADRPMQHSNSFSSRGSNGSSMNGDPWMSSAPRIPGPPGGQKPFVPSYRLFEDLNVFGNADARFKMTSSTSPSLSGSSGQGMVGGRK